MVLLLVALGTWPSWDFVSAINPLWRWLGLGSTDSSTSVQPLLRGWRGSQQTNGFFRERAGHKVSKGKPSTTFYMVCMSSRRKHCRINTLLTPTSVQDRDPTSMMTPPCLAVKWGICHQENSWITFGFADWKTQTLPSRDNFSHLPEPQKALIEIIAKTDTESVSYSSACFSKNWNIQTLL